MPTSLELLNEHVPRWRARPTAYVMDVFQVVPDVWQAEALVHLADRPRSVSELSDIFLEIRKGYYLRARDKDKGARFASHNYKVSSHWRNKEWLQRDFERPFRRVSIASGHGVGKSTCMAWADLWMQTCFFPLKIGATAPTAHQLEDVLWAEISKWHSAMPKWLRAQIIVGSLRVSLSGNEMLSFTTGKTARREQPEALQGLHQDNTGVLVDECSGVPDVVFESSEGIMTSENTRALLCSNPTRVSGFFYDTHDRLDNWYTMRVSGEKNPRVGNEFIRQIANRYGLESNGYRVRVLGEFPRMDDDSVIPKYMFDAAVGRDVRAFKDAAVVWGVDPARFGDDRTALSKRKGNVKLGPTKFWSKQDTMQTVGRIVHEYEQTALGDRPTDIVVDVIGIGAGVVDRLREAGMPVTALNVADTATEQEGFQRVYSELWWRARQWFEAGDCAIEVEDRAELQSFRREMCTPRYKMLSNGKVVVESKSDVKKRVQEKQSPDLAESFVLTFGSTRGRINRAPKKIPYRSINPLARVAR